jgi:hypothetical protein
MKRGSSIEEPFFIFSCNLNACFDFLVSRLKISSDYLYKTYISYL